MSRRAFTLLEVVLSLSLTILLLGASLTFLWQLADRRTTLARGSRDLHAAAVLIERIEADLASGIAGDAGIGAGIQGTEYRLKILSRGVWLAAGEAAGATAGGEAGGDLQASEYEFDPSQALVRARRYVVKPGASAPTGRMEVVTDRVERLRFRYYDGRQWATSFNSLEKGSLPVAIEVAMWFTPLKNAAAPPLVETPTGEGASDAESVNTASVEFDVAERRWPAPDRLRVIIVPDGPAEAWKEGTP